MKIFVIRGRTIVAAALALSLSLAAVSAGYWRVRWRQNENAAETAASASCSLPIYSVETDGKKVSLGINCAWDNADIPSLLETLDAAEVKATFFLLGQWVEKYPESVKAILDAGHEVGSHSYTHDDMTAMTAEQIAQAATLAMETLEKAGVRQPVLFRPPSGAYNNQVIDTLNGLGCLPIQWSIDTLDWKKLTADEIVVRVAAQMDNGAILLLHSGAEHTAEALPQMIETLKGGGFEIVPVGDLVYHDHYTIDVQGRQHKAG